MRKVVVRSRRGSVGGCGRAMVEGLEGRRMLTAAVVGTLPAVQLDAGTTAGGTVDLGAYFADAAAPANTVFINTSVGTVPVELTPGATPLTVANFLNYVTSGRYNGTFFHRSVPGFVVQGGGFAVDNNQVGQRPTDAPVQNEFDPSRSNVRGTVAMAKLGSDPNSATNQFFFNLADNSSNLDNQNGGFTVFGNVVGAQGLAVMDALAAVPVVDASGGNPNSPFTELPVRDFQSGGDITLDKLLYLNSVTQGAAFTVASDDTSVLAVDVHDHRLVYTPTGKNGTAHVTVTAAGVDGQAVQQTFAVTVGTPAVDPTPDPTSDPTPDPVVVVTPVKVAKGGSVLFKDGDGTTVTVKSTGPGTLTFNFGGTGVTAKTVKGVTTVTGTGLTLESIATTGANGGTVITVTTKGGNGMVDVGGVSGAVGSFIGTGVNLVGVSAVKGTVNTLTVKSSSADSSFTAGSVGTVTVSGTMSGDWRVGSVKTISAGTISDAQVVTTGGGQSMGSVTAKKVVGSQLRSKGNIGTVNVSGTMTGSQVFAGVSPDALATAAIAGAGKGQIGSIKVGSGGKGNQLADSAIGAGMIKSAVLGNFADVPSAAEFYGVEAGQIVSMAGFVNSKAFSVKNVKTQAELDAQLAKEKVALTNVKLVVV